MRRGGRRSGRSQDLRRRRERFCGDQHPAFVPALCPVPRSPPPRLSGRYARARCSPSLPSAKADRVLPIVPTAESACRPCRAAHPPWPPLHKGGKGNGASCVDPAGAGVEVGEPGAAPSSLPTADCVLPTVRPIGLVGPMSNFVAPPQLVENVPYRDVNEMHRFAKQWRDERRKQWFTVPKLSGFCLLMKRAVYDKIGGLDERFGLGLFDDDDLAERARRAGFELAVAHDLFVHHFGSRTFLGNGIDIDGLLEENARRFAAKWGLAGGNNGRQVVALRPWKQPEEGVGNGVCGRAMRDPGRARLRPSRARPRLSRSFALPRMPTNAQTGRARLRPSRDQPQLSTELRPPKRVPSQDRANAPNGVPEPRVRVAWEGDFDALHSLAIVNRAVCRGLIDRGHDLRLIASSTLPAVETDERVELDARLRQRRLAAAGTSAARDGLSVFDAHVHVRHCWPPVIEPPVRGKWVLMQPWEFGSLPKAWVPMLRQVDEVWAYSRYVRDCYLEAEVPRRQGSRRAAGRRARAVSAGPRAIGSRSPGRNFGCCSSAARSIVRGSTCLLSAFARAFRPGDGVGLVIKEMGSKSFYRGQTAEAEVAALRERGYSVEYIDRILSEAEMAGALLRLRRPGATVSRRRLRLADRRGDGLRAAGHRHRRGAGAGLCQ